MHLFEGMQRNEWYAGIQIWREGLSYFASGGSFSQVKRLTDSGDKYSKFNDIFW